MTQKHVENTLTKKTGRTSMIIVASLSAVFVICKLCAIFLGGNVRLIEDVLSVIVILAWLILIVVSACKKRIKKVIVSLMVLVVLVGFSVIHVADARFSVYQKQYEEAAKKAFSEFEQSEDVFFLPLSRDESDLLGEMHLFADKGNIALSFCESNTLFDYYCYVRVFSEKDVSEIIPNLEYCKDLGSGWYYVNLY